MLNIETSLSSKHDSNVDATLFIALKCIMLQDKSNMDMFLFDGVRNVSLMTSVLNDDTTLNIWNSFHIAHTVTFWNVPHSFVDVECC